MLKARASVLMAAAMECTRLRLKAWLVVITCGVVRGSHDLGHRTWTSCGKMLTCGKTVAQGVAASKVTPGE